jgi:hypothetical protein
VPDFRYVATHICDSVKRRLKTGGMRDLQGEIGIGLLSFWTMGEELAMACPAADGRVYEMRMRKGDPAARSCSTVSSSSRFIPRSTCASAHAFPTGFFVWRDRLEAQHARHTREALEEYYAGSMLDEDAFICHGNEMLDGVAAFWDGLEAQRLTLQQRKRYAAPSLRSGRNGALMRLWALHPIYNQPDFLKR